MAVRGEPGASQRGGLKVQNAASMAQQGKATGRGGWVCYNCLILQAQSGSHQACPSEKYQLFNPSSLHRLFLSFSVWDGKLLCI